MKKAMKLNIYTKELPVSHPYGHLTFFIISMLQHVAHLFITDWETLATVDLQQLFDQTGTKISTDGELLLKLPTTTSV